MSVLQRGDDSNAAAEGEAVVSKFFQDERRRGRRSLFFEHLDFLKTDPSKRDGPQIEKFCSFLVKFFFFRDLPDCILARIADTAEIKGYPATTKLYSQGEKNKSSISFVLSGSIELYRSPVMDGNYGRLLRAFRMSKFFGKTLSEVFGPLSHTLIMGDVIGYESVYGYPKRQHTAITKKASVVLVISDNHLLSSLSEVREMPFDFHSGTCGEIFLKEPGERSREEVAMLIDQVGEARCLKGFGPTILRDIFQTAKVEHLDPGAVVIRVHEVVPHLIFILSGVIEMRTGSLNPDDASSHLASGDRDHGHMVQHFFRGDIIGELNIDDFGRVCDLQPETFRFVVKSEAFDMTSASTSGIGGADIIKIPKHLVTEGGGGEWERPDLQIREWYFLLGKAESSRTERDVKKISTLMTSLSFFQQLPESVRKELARSVRILRVGRQTEIQRQGEVCTDQSEMCVILKGTVDVHIFFVDPKSPSPLALSALHAASSCKSFLSLEQLESYFGKRVATLKVGDAFGEAAMQSKSGIRTATTITAEDCDLIIIDLPAFKSILAKRNKVVFQPQQGSAALLVPPKKRTEQDLLMISKCLRAMSYFNPLGEDGLAHLAKHVVGLSLQDKEIIFEQGIAGDTMYAVFRGSVVAHMNLNVPAGSSVSQLLAKSGKPVRGMTKDEVDIILGPVVGLLSSGDVFGEMALYKNNAKRSSSAVARGPTQLLCIHRDLLKEYIKIMQSTTSFQPERLRLILQVDPKSRTEEDLLFGAKMLKGINAFSQLGNQTLLDISRQMQLRKVGADSVVFMRGERVDGMFVCLSGSVSLYSKSSQVPKGQTSTVKESLPHFSERRRVTLVKTQFESSVNAASSRSRLFSRSLSHLSLLSSSSSPHGDVEGGMGEGDSEEEEDADPHKKDYVLRKLRPSTHAVRTIVALSMKKKLKNRLGTPESIPSTPLSPTPQTDSWDGGSEEGQAVASALSEKEEPALDVQEAAADDTCHPSRPFGLFQFPAPMSKKLHRQISAIATQPSELIFVSRESVESALFASKERGVEKVTEVMAAMGVFGNVPRKALSLIAASMRKRRCTSGDILFSPNTDADKIFVVVQGNVNIGAARNSPLFPRKYLNDENDVRCVKCLSMTSEQLCPMCSIRERKRRGHGPQSVVVGVATSPCVVGWAKESRLKFATENDTDISFKPRQFILTGVCDGKTKVFEIEMKELWNVRLGFPLFIDAALEGIERESETRLNRYRDDIEEEDDDESFALLPRSLMPAVKIKFDPKATDLRHQILQLLHEKPSTRIKKMLKDFGQTEVTVGKKQLLMVLGPSPPELPRSLSPPPKSSSLRTPSTSSKHATPAVERSATAEARHAKKEKERAIQAARWIIGTGTTVEDFEIPEKIKMETPLPPGWEMAVDDEGNVFFIDHLNGNTSWNDPRLAVIGPLPDGWEEMKDEDGETYFVDHINCVSTWHDPRQQFQQPVFTVKIKAPTTAATVTQTAPSFSLLPPSSPLFPSKSIGTVTTPPPPPLDYLTASVRPSAHQIIQPKKKHPPPYIHTTDVENAFGEVLEEDWRKWHLIDGPSKKKREKEKERERKEKERGKRRGQGAQNPGEKSELVLPLIVNNKNSDKDSKNINQFENGRRRSVSSLSNWTASTHYGLHEFLRPRSSLGVEDRTSEYALLEDTDSDSEDGDDGMLKQFYSSKEFSHGAKKKKVMRQPEWGVEFLIGDTHSESTETSSSLNNILPPKKKFAAAMTNTTPKKTDVRGPQRDPKKIPVSAATSLAISPSKSPVMKPLQIKPKKEAQTHATSPAPTHTANPAPAHAEDKFSTNLGEMMRHPRGSPWGGTPSGPQANLGHYEPSRISRNRIDVGSYQTPPTTTTNFYLEYSTLEGSETGSVYESEYLPPDPALVYLKPKESPIPLDSKRRSKKSPVPLHATIGVTKPKRDQSDSKRQVTFDPKESLTPEPSRQSPLGVFSKREETMTAQQRKVRQRDDAAVDSIVKALEVFDPDVYRNLNEKIDRLTSRILNEKSELQKSNAMETSMRLDQIQRLEGQQKLLQAIADRANTQSYERSKAKKSSSPAKGTERARHVSNSSPSFAVKGGRGIM